MKKIYIWKWACEYDIMPEYEHNKYYDYSESKYHEIVDLALSRGLYVMLHEGDYGGDDDDTTLTIFFDKRKFTQR